MFDEPFLGCAAVAAGRVTPDQLRGPGFRRLFHGIFAGAGVEVDLALRARAAALVSDGRGVVAGWAAAELFGASCAPGEVPVELFLRSGGRRQPGLVVVKGAVDADEVTQVGAVRVTTPARTAFDLARKKPLVHAIVGVDALRYACGVDVEDVRLLANRHRGARGMKQVWEVLSRSTHLAASPMETRLRVALVDGGLPPPVLQHLVGPYFLDLAYPEWKIAIEYDGREHLTAERARRDLVRQAYLTNAGWTVVRFSASIVLHERWRIASDVRSLLRAR